MRSRTVRLLNSIYINIYQWTSDTKKLHTELQIPIFLNGVMENAGLENDVPTKINGVENARQENDGLKNRAGKCRTGKCRTTHRRKST